MGMSQMSCLVIDDCRTRVCMSTFVRTTSRSHLAKSLNTYQRQQCKPCIKGSPEGAPNRVQGMGRRRTFITSKPSPLTSKCLLLFYPLNSF